MLKYIINPIEGISFEPGTDTIDRINLLASTETSKLFCPSYKKTKAKRKQGRPRKQLPEVSEGVHEITNLRQYEHTVTDPAREILENLILVTPLKHPSVTTGPTLGELLQSAPILQKRA